MSERAIALEQMLARRPGDPRLRFGLAVEYLNEGALEKGAAALEVYLSIADDEGNGWGRLAGVLAELGRTEDAKRAYEAGIGAAQRHGHPSLAAELRSALEELS